MTIIDLIRKTLDKVGVKLYYGSPADLNDLFDDVDWDTDCIVAYIPAIQSGGLTNDSGDYKERISCYVSFVTQGDVDPTGEKNERQIEACKHKAIEWLVSLNSVRQNYLSLVSVGQTNRVYDEFDEIVTGFGVSVDLEEVNGLGPCDFL